MLPSKANGPGHPHVLIYLLISESADLSQVLANIGASPSAKGLPFATFPTQPNVLAIVQRPSQVDDRILDSCDALVVALDGATGVDPTTIQTWAAARDATLPRHILGFNVVHGRADFDELCAISSRVLEPDLLVRFLPIDSDDELSLTGVYDILTSEIHAIVASKWITKAADPEHIAITSSAREDLFDQLAYLGLDDATLRNHRNGLPISVTKLEEAWLHPDVVAITPIDDGVGEDIFADWLTNLLPIWIPVMVQDGVGSQVNETQERIGISITESLARMWGPGADQLLVEKSAVGDKKIDVIDFHPVALLAANLTPGKTIATKRFDAVLVTPVC